MSELRLRDARNYSRRIRIAAPENPKRHGSQSARDFDLYRDNMPVVEYLQDTTIPRRRARANLAWDIERGHITIT